MLLRKRHIPKLILAFFGILAFYSGLAASGSRPVNVPLKMTTPGIKDGEWIKMGCYVRGEKTEEWFLVSRIHPQEETVEIFGFIRDLSSGEAIPGHYTNFSHIRGIISLKTGSLLYDKYQEPKKDYKGLVAEEYRFSETGGEVIYKADFWDGYEIKKRTSRVQVKKGYPVWEVLQLMSYGARFLDIREPGIVYACKLDIIKEAIPLAFIPQRKEVITTPAGKFNTTKIVFAIADPFLSKLSEPFLKELTMWVENSPRSLMVQAVNPAGNVYTVEEISNVLSTKN